MAMNKQQKRRRDRLFDEYPYCFWCNVRVVKPEGAGRQPDNSATLDHLFNRLSSERQKPHRPSDQPRTVLSCYKCNFERGRLAVAFRDLGAIG